MTKKICIIGAGASGLTGIKTCLENGLDVDCYEMTDDIGGLWRYTDALVGDERACVMKSTVINTSKEMMAYSDFPMPDHYPLFTHNTKVLEYFRMYADQFNLLRHIQFKTKVEYCQRSSDYDQTGRWQVTLVDVTNRDNKRVVEYDGVLLGTGHHATPYLPHFEGLKDVFEGKVTHTHDYRTSKGYEDENILIIGIGNSGGDVAVELSQVAKQVYLSTRRGSWVFHRISDNGYPIDMIFSRRPMKQLGRLLPSLMEKFTQYQLNSRFDHANYGLKPKNTVLSQHPLINDGIANRIASGTLRIVPDVKRFTKNGVEFVDGTSVEGIDKVIVATGYTFGFPYVEEGVIPVRNNEVNLYEYMFPTHLKHPTLGVLGCLQQLGAIMPICEMQSRWFCRIINGDIRLPSEGDMKRYVERKREFVKKTYVTSQRHTMEVDYVEYMDKLADKVGCKPNFISLFKSDPLFALICYLGPVVPYQYRLCGPHPWTKAQEAVETQWERTIGGTNPRGSITSQTSNMSSHTSPYKRRIAWYLLIFMSGLFIILALFLTWIF